MRVHTGVTTMHALISRGHSLPLVQVVLAYGADEDRRLGIPGEDLEGAMSARTFVNWYNGHPEYAHLGPSITAALDRCPKVVVLGHGNVALDCTFKTCASQS